MHEKITQKKQVRNTVKTIQPEASEQHGKGLSTDLEKELLKIKYVGVGVCPQCGKEYVRNGELTHVVCTCKSVVLIELAPALILPHKLEVYLDNLAKQIGCTSDELLNACFEVGLANLEERLEVIKVDKT